LALARRALEAAVRGLGAPAVPREATLEARRGAFVALHAGSELRGCLGHIPCDRPLAAVVAHMAAAVAHEDRRFAPVTPEELAAIRIEISVLGEPSALVPRDPRGIAIGRDGLIVRQRDALGLLLPQVALEQGWTAEAFLSATCRKAGLAADAWRQGGVEVLTFQADVFGE
jgi:AmmeMemoRadiSam system protein A